VGCVNSEWLDFDAFYLGLEQPQMTYRDFVEQGISPDEQLFIKQTVERNQLTGSGMFVDEIEQRLEVRVEHREPARPRKREK
jgi:hypothetical protein